jgi:hypothetical protein
MIATIRLHWPIASRAGPRPEHGEKHAHCKHEQCDVCRKADQAADAGVQESENDSKRERASHCNERSFSLRSLRIA